MPISGDNSSSTRIANDERSHVGLLSGEHQAPQLALVHRRTNGKVGDGPQESQVEGSVVRGTIGAHQSGSVEADDHVEAQDGHVVDDVVVGPLCKRGIDVAERQQPILCHTCRESDGVALGDAHVESAVGHGLHHDVHRAARRHGWRNTHDARIQPCQFEERLAKHTLELWRLSAGVALLQLSCLGVELPWGVPHRRVVLGGRIAVSLLRMQVQQLGASHVLNLSEDAHQLHHVVAVERPKVADVHAIENILLMRDGALQSVAQSDESLAAVVLQQAVPLHPSCRLEAQFVVGLVGAQPQEILLHAAHGAVDGHVVVVEDDEHVVGTRRHVVESLEGQPTTHGTVANDGHNLSRVRSEE